MTNYNHITKILNQVFEKQLWDLVYNNVGTYRDAKDSKEFFGIDKPTFSNKWDFPSNYIAITYKTSFCKEASMLEMQIIVKGDCAFLVVVRE